MGALQFSIFTRRGSEPSLADARELAVKFANERHWPLDAVDLEVGRSEAGVFSRMSYTEPTGDYWCVWHVATTARMALVTYNCRKEDEAVERAVIDEVFRSFAWEERII